MEERNKKSAEYISLRQKLEKQSKKNQLAKATPISEGNTLKLLHKLQMHKIELEMQNAVLIESEEKFKAIFNNAEDGMFVFDLGTRTPFLCNPSCARMLGYKQEEFLSLDISDIHPKEDLPFIFEQIDKLHMEEKPLIKDVRFRRKNGTTFFADITPSLIRTDKKDYVLLNFKDITERKLMEEELKKHREELENLVKERTAKLQLEINGRKKAEELLLSEKEFMAKSQAIAHLGSWELDIVDNILLWSDESYRIFGLHPHEFEATYEAFLKIVHPDDRKAVNDAYSNSIKQGKDNYEIIHRIILKATGEIRYVHERCEHIKDNTGKIIRSVGFTQDITEQKLEENKREAVTKLLNIANIHTDIKSFIHEVTDFLQKLSACDAVGIRIKSGEDYPYFETRGFPKEFVCLENSLFARNQDGQLLRDNTGNPALECICGEVICHMSNSSTPYFTSKGSFWTNSATQLCNSISKTDRKIRVRNRCIIEGYESVALIPLHARGESLGLLQFNDKSKGHFSSNAISFLEYLAEYLSVALSRFIAEDQLKKLNEELEDRVRQRTKEFDSERQRLYDVLETLPVYVILLDKDYRVPFANKFFRDRFGESHGKRCYEYLFKKDAPCDNCETYKVMKTNSSHFWEWTGPDGRNYEIYDYPFIEKDGSRMILEMGIDITERKKAEKRIAELASIPQLSPVLIIELDEACNLYYLNPEAKSILPILENENCLRCEFFANLNDIIKKIKKQKVKSLYREIEYNDKWYGQFIYSAPNSRILIYSNDITDHKKTEEMRERLISIIEKSSDFIGFADAKDKNIIYLNAAGREMCGIRKNEDVSNLKLSEIHPEWANKKICEEMLPAVIRDGTWKGECSFINIKNKHEIPVSMVISSHNNAKGEIEVFSTISRDISLLKKEQQERLDLEKQLYHSQRIEDIGAIASGITHDFNNILATILGLTDILLSKNYEDYTKIEYIKMINTAAKRGTSLTKQILAFSKPNEIKYEVIDILPIIHETLKMLESSLKHVAQTSVTVIPKQRRPIIGDASQIGQMLLNLILNARDAMEGKWGKLDIILDEVSLLPNKLPLKELKSGSYLKLTIRDTGRGITPDIKEKIFEKFFTSKGAKGTGLGLSVVKRVLNNHKGTITLNSEPGKGTTFDIYIPTADAS
ncbi:MAG TPA: hypothetical protein DD381_13495 [Lentisphaeria bacterium]|nr:MAG: hypothetical protein A2X47_09965 [Lentisphaerae bacterium GWF2_38_69]HBM17336.1 hypothetical protein [Lentisphaeria bacterium]